MIFTRMRPSLGAALLTALLSLILPITSTAAPTVRVKDLVEVFQAGQYEDDT